MKDQKFASIPMNSSTVQQKRTRIGSPQLSLMLVGVLLFGIVFSFHFHDSKPRNSLSRERQPSFVSDQAVTPKFSVNEADPSLKVAWLMSFPNSGAFNCWDFMYSKFGSFL